MGVPIIDINMPPKTLENILIWVLIHLVKYDILFNDLQRVRDDEPLPM